MNIYTTTPTKKTITGFIKALYSHEISRGKVAVPTYLDEEFTEVECRHARRSFEDLLAIVRTRYPKTSKERVARACKQLCDKHGFVWHVCATIRKPVLFCGSVRMPIEIYPEYRLGGGYEAEAYQVNAEYKVEDILSLMGVINEVEL